MFLPDSADAHDAAADLDGLQQIAVGGRGGWIAPPSSIREGEAHNAADYLRPINWERATPLFFFLF